MANHKSALKRIRQNEKRRNYNRAFRNRSRTFVKKARAALASGDLDAAREATRLAVIDLDKNVSRGVLHPNNAARRKSRLMKQLRALETLARASSSTDKTEGQLIKQLWTLETRSK